MKKSFISIVIPFFLFTGLWLFGSVSPAYAIEIAFEPDQRLPIVYLNVAVKAGASSDPKDRHGLTHFMGRMLLRGTQLKSKQQLDLELDEMGGFLEVEVRSEATIFRGAVLSENLKRFTDLLFEILTRPSFDEKEIRKLKAELSSELLADQGSDRTVAQRWHQRFLFGDHPYGNIVEGSLGSIKKIEKSDLEAQYDRLVRNKALLVVGTGKADNGHIREFAGRLAVARPGGGGAIASSPPNAKDKPSLLIVDKPDRTQTQIYAGQIGMTMLDPNFFALTLGNHAFGGGSFQARMMKEIRVQRGWSYGAYSFFRFGTHPHSWSFWLFPASQYAAEALAYSIEMANKFRDSGLSQEEFDFAKNALVNNSGFRYNTPQKRVENILTERTLGLPSGFMKSFGTKISELKLDQVNHAFKNFLKPEKFSIVVLGTAKDLKDKLSKATGLEPSQIKTVRYTDEP